MKNIIIIVLSLMISMVQADDRKNLTEPVITHIVKAPKGVRVTKNMIFLFDCSHSMGKNNRFKIAMRELKAIIGSVDDDGMFSLMCFKEEEENISSWPGIREEDDPNPSPPGWAKLPSYIAMKSANDFLNNMICDNFTDVGSVIKKAFDLNTKKDNLTILLFTDGNNTHPWFNGKKPTGVAKEIEELQKSRTDKGKDLIRIFVVGVSSEQNVVMLSAIAKAGNGGYMTTEKICNICKANKENVAEVQRVHRGRHLSKTDKNYQDGF